MMWLPKAVKIVTQVECLASWAACLAATAGSTSSLFVACGLRGAEGRIRFMGFALETSTRTGWSSKREATKRRLETKGVSFYGLGDRKTLGRLLVERV